RRRGRQHPLAQPDWDEPFGGTSMPAACFAILVLVVDLLAPVAAYTALNKGDPWLRRPRRCAVGASCLLLAGLTLSFPAVVAQETASPIAELERYPLRPLDASSPQATLQGFVTSIEAAANVILAGGPMPAAETLAYR